LQKIYFIKNSAPFFRLFGKGALRIFYREVSRKKYKKRYKKREENEKDRSFIFRGNCVVNDIRGTKRQKHGSFPVLWIFFESCRKQSVKEEGGYRVRLDERLSGKRERSFLMLTPLYFRGLRALSFGIPSDGLF
jgi:hypothetical protein